MYLRNSIYTVARLFRKNSHEPTSRELRPRRRALLDARSEYQTRIAMGVCFSRCSRSSGRVDARGGPPGGTRVTSCESTGYPVASENLQTTSSRLRERRAAADDVVQDDRPVQRLRTVADDNAAAGEIR